MCPGDVLSAEATLDVRVDGAFRIVMKSREREHVHTGTYQVVEPPSKLVFTWTAADTPGEMTLVTLELVPHGEESELVLTHERFPKSDVTLRYKTGWGTIAEKFCGVSGAPQARVEVNRWIRMSETRRW